MSDENVMWLFLYIGRNLHISPTSWVRPLEKTSRRGLTSVRISIAALFTALVALATMAFSVYIPATRGYFNIGEVMVYTTAILFGARIGAFAGGVGSMLSDLLLGYSVYAPATLVIKATEGGLVGMLSNRGVRFGSRKSWRAFTITLGLIIAAIVGYLGVTLYAGGVELTVGLPNLSSTIQFEVPSIFWIMVSAVVAILVSSIGFLYDPQLGWTMLSVLAGGTTMVLGYFAYEVYLYGGVASASVELPANIGQAVIGLVLGLPLSQLLLRRAPVLRRLTL